MFNTFYHTPGIDTTPEPSTFTLHLNITPNHCKRDAVLQRDGGKTQLSALTMIRWHVSKRTSQLTNLKRLVLFLQVFILIRIALGKLVDVDPKLFDLLSDLR